MRSILFVMLLAFVGCAGENELYEPPTEKEKSEKKGEGHVWICHNPESDFHGGECVPECMERGNPYKFCWLKEWEDEE